MKALMMILAVAVTMTATTSHATLRVLPCGKVYNDQDVTLGNQKGVLNASNLAQYQPRPQQGQASAVFIGN